MFFAATLPNLLLSPIAGTFVDRWDHKEVMVVSDLLRAAIVLLIPLAAVTNILLVYPLIFLVTTISIFFRPARVAILPRIVPEEDLLTANSALWVGETIADIVGYPLAGLFVALLGSAVPLAFWVDSATYVASAALLATIVVAAAAAARRAGGRPSDRTRLRRRARPRAGSSCATRRSCSRTRSRARSASSASASSIALTPTLRPGDVRAVGLRLAGRVRLPRDRDRARQPDRRVRHRAHRDALREGPDGDRRLRAVGRPDVPVRAERQPGGRARAVRSAQGVANMVFVIPSQTLFQERTPPELMGRVVGLPVRAGVRVDDDRDAARVVLGQVVGPAPVIAVFGLVTVVAGLAGLLVPAVRDA